MCQFGDAVDKSFVRCLDDCLYVFHVFGDEKPVDKFVVIMTIVRVNTCINIVCITGVDGTAEKEVKGSGGGSEILCSGNGKGDRGFWWL